MRFYWSHALQTVGHPDISGTRNKGPKGSRRPSAAQLPPPLSGFVLQSWQRRSILLKLIWSFGLRVPDSGSGLEGSGVIISSQFWPWMSWVSRQTVTVVDPTRPSALRAWEPLVLLGSAWSRWKALLRSLILQPVCLQVNKYPMFWDTSHKFSSTCLSIQLQISSDLISL